MKHSILIHECGDGVGVAVRDLKAGDNAGIKTLEGQDGGTVKVIEEIPLGHKVALHDMAEGQDVIEYGRSIGRTTQAISTGAHVHIHNLKSKRWE